MEREYKNTFFLIFISSGRGQMDGKATFICIENPKKMIDAVIDESICNEEINEIFQPKPAIGEWKALNTFVFGS